MMNLNMGPQGTSSATSLNMNREQQQLNSSLGGIIVYHFMPGVIWLH